MRFVSLFLLLSSLVSSPSVLFAQGGAARKPDPPFPAHRVIGNIYFVGTANVSSHLITTPEGHFLIDATWEANVPQIRASVEMLGFRFGDIKFLLTAHAHGDHVEGMTLMKELTGAQVVVMDRDVSAMQRLKTPSGKLLPVDQVMHHLERISLGGVTLTAHLTPGHTPGNTTWTLRAQEGGRTYDVVIPGAVAPNPGTRLADNKEYPTIIEDNHFFYRYLRIIPCDVMLGTHGRFYNLEQRFAQMNKGTNPYINGQQDCLKQIDEWQNLFDSRLADDKKRIESATQR
jgi:metallo-beta-lactamase class B